MEELLATTKDDRDEFADIRKAKGGMIMQRELEK